MIQSQAVCMDEKDRTISSKERENQQLRQQLLQERDRANRQLEETEGQHQKLQEESVRALKRTKTQLQEKERQLGRVNQQLEASEQVVAQFERRIAELEQQLSQREQQKTKTSRKGKELTSLKLRWRKGKRAPCGINRSYDAVVDGNKVYFRNGGSKKIYSYDATSDSWSELPDCFHWNGSITVINGLLTTAGGISYPYYSNELFSLTGKSSGRRWIKKFPPMPTKRRWMTTLCTGTILIVAGGQGEGSRVLSTVEVMNTETHQWFTAADLPQPMTLYCASATLNGDQLYMLGGWNQFSTAVATKSVYTCSVSALLQSCAPSSLEANLERASLVDKASGSVWRQVADLPVTRSTCDSFHGRLLAVGGKRDSEKATTAVYMYDSTTDSWEIISHMITGRYQCFTAVLPDYRLMIVGGHTDLDDTDTVEFVKIIYSLSIISVYTFFH